MISLEKQKELLIRISEKMQKMMIIYAIGGTAMMLRGVKIETLDIDLVFASENDRTVFKNIAESLGYEEIGPEILYGKKENAPFLIKLGDARLDLFSLDVLGVRFSEEMIKRATETHQFEKNLVIKPADLHDLVVMKSITCRAKDEEDIIYIIKNFKVDWNIIVKEAENQVSLGNERAILNLGFLLEKLNNEAKLQIPEQVLDKIWALLGKQTRRRQKFQRNKTHN